MIGWRYRDTVLGVCTLALFVTVFGRLALSPVVPDIATDFEVSNALIGAALSGMWLAYAVTQFPSGILADRYGERVIILVAILGTGVTTLVIVGSPSFVVFLLGTVLLGAVAGLHYSVATTLLARIYDDIGTAIGIHNLGAPLAGLVTPIVVSIVAVRQGWRPAVFLSTLVALPVFALALWRMRPTEPRRPSRPMRQQFDREPIAELLSRPPVVFTGVIAILGEFVWQALASFLPAFLVGHHGYSTTLAATLFGVYFVCLGGFQIGVGVVSDRIGRDRATGICMAAGIVGLSLLIVSDGRVPILVGLVALGLGMSWAAAVFPRLMDRLADAERGFGFGLFRSVYMIVASAGSVVVGLLADLFGWGASFGFLLGLLVIVGLLLLVNTIFELGY